MSVDGSVLLPRGLYDEGGVCHREAVLRPITGHEEMALGGASPGAASAFLARCLMRIGDYHDPDRGHVAALTRGDRQHLALHLRARMFGEGISLVVPCPNPACRALADMDLDIPSLAPERVVPVPESITVETPDGTALLREPTGADDELLERLGPEGGDRRRRAALLWSRLVLDLGGRGPMGPEAWLALGAETRGAIGLALAEQGSALDLAFLAPCPSCKALLEIELEPIDLLARELRLGEGRLLTEIHCLAWYYHWSEADVLALPRARRWRYLELLTRQVEGRPLLEPTGAA
jgi:hypothetical protein